MEFEIKGLEIIDAEKSPNSQHSYGRRTPTETNAPLLNSIVINELYKESEELQNKLKLNYRRLLLFETENNKLIEEKNKLFFEAQDFFQKNQILSEKNEILEKQNTLTEHNQKLMLEKINSYEKINKAQLIEIRRFSKFHTKIQEVVKPFIIQLKKQIIELKNELSQSQKINTNLTNTYKEFCRKIELELKQKNNEITSLYVEKNGLIKSYEEQIHSFSKEIIELQGKNENAHNEISRLKKSVEFKNYFENEVIRFKRTHEEDQKIVTELAQKKSAADANVLLLEQTLSETKTEVFSLRNRSLDLETTLDVSRTQLAKKIHELTVLNERLSRLESLNNQLSLEMSSK